MSAVLFLWSDGEGPPTAYCALVAWIPVSRRNEGPRNVQICPDETDVQAAARAGHQPAELSCAAMLVTILFVRGLVPVTLWMSKSPASWAVMWSSAFATVPTMVLIIGGQLALLLFLFGLPLTSLDE